MSTSKEDTWDFVNGRVSIRLNSTCQSSVIEYWYLFVSKRFVGESVNFCHAYDGNNWSSNTRTYRRLTKHPAPDQSVLSGLDCRSNPSVGMRTVETSLITGSRTILPHGQFAFHFRSFFGELSRRCSKKARPRVHITLTSRTPLGSLWMILEIGGCGWKILIKEPCPDDWENY